MPQWFKCKIKFLRQMDTGLIKKVSETYLVDALSFTEAEATVLREIGEGLKEVTLMSAARSNIREVVKYGDTELWHKVKVTYSALDDESEKEKKITTYLLVQSENVKEAYERAEDHLKEMLVPYSLPQIVETAFLDVLHHIPGVTPSMKSVGLSPEQPA